MRIRFLKPRKVPYWPPTGRNPLRVRSEFDVLIHRANYTIERTVGPRVSQNAHPILKAAQGSVLATHRQEPAQGRILHLDTVRLTRQVHEIKVAPVSGFRCGRYQSRIVAES